MDRTPLRNLGTDPIQLQSPGTVRIPHQNLGNREEPELTRRPTHQLREAEEDGDHSQRE